MAAYIFDVEADGLLDQATKIHVLSYTPLGSFEPKSLFTKEDILEFLNQDDLILIGHNIVMYDVPTLKKVLGYTGKPTLVDTLGISWYIEASSGRQLHGLDKYGEELGVKKPEITDWEGLTKEEYAFRCERDVEINYLLFKEIQQPYLRELYSNDSKEIKRLLEYITFKLDCFRIQAEIGITLDVDLCVDELFRLQEMADDKYNALKQAMPKLPIKSVMNYPKRMFKTDGELTAMGEKWVKLLKEVGYPEDWTEPVEFVKGFEEPNPNSGDQVKNWLYSLGWEPQHIKHYRDKKNNGYRKVPNISSEYSKGEVCDSVKALIEKDPAVEHLAGLSTLNHRIGVLKGFIENSVDLKLYQSVGKFTNTMRISHRVLVNIPKPGNLFAENIRAVLTCGEDELMCGADLSGIEDVTKQSYIFPYDPEYVNEMRSDDWDPHTNIAVVSSLMTKEEEKEFKRINEKRSKEEELTEEEKELFNRLKDVRQQAKTVNFSSTYKVGKKTLARNLKSTEEFAQKLLDGFWEKNKAILQIEASIERKTVRGQLWVKQPVSGFWYSLRAEKDIFSTINQSTAVYVFDTWIKHIHRRGVKVCYQSHDEIMVIVNKEEKDFVSSVLLDAMEDVNNELQLHVPISFEQDWGKTYLEVH